MKDAESDANEADSPIVPDADTSMTPYVTAVASFLSAMFSNSSIRAEFSMRGGIEYVLDLADSPCLTYDFSEGSTSRMLHSVVAQLAESKPHLVIPSLLKKAQSAADRLIPFTSYGGNTPFFAAFINLEAQQSTDSEFLANGTDFGKALVNINSLIPTLNACFQASAYSHRSSPTSFNQLNLADYYVRLVQSLGPILGVSIKEGIRIQSSIPDSWSIPKTIKDSGFGQLTVDGLLGMSSPSPINEELGANGATVTDPMHGVNGATPPNGPIRVSSASQKKPESPPKSEQDTPQFKNYQTLRHLLARVRQTTPPFLQTLGKALVTKRNPEAFQKQSNVAIAEALAESILQQMAPSQVESSMDHHSFWIAMFTPVKEMLIEGKQYAIREPMLKPMLTCSSLSA